MSAPRRSKLDPLIERIRLDKLTIFEITEAELDALARGSTESLFFNLSIAALSTGVSFLIALLTTTIEDNRTFAVFVIVCGFGFVCGVTFTLLWWQLRRSLKSVAQTIRDRKPSQGIQAPENETSP